ncbi:MAG: sn-glycerol-1-phosphate dehydrogenase [Anaerolineae bacterium]|nr:sn-glycerol-1-phosphate dehydrogenase [Anaerolineae bacterium]
MNLRFDPGHIDSFKEEIKHIPGYPIGEELPIREMVFESGAIFRLPELLKIAGAKRENPVLVVMDRTPMRRGMTSLKPLIIEILQKADWNPYPIWLENHLSGQVHTDQHQIETVKNLLNPNVSVVSVGSGVVTDITKHACYLFELDNQVSLPLVFYQTANSVSAYTSNMAPVFVDGVKRTLPSRYPDVLVCDLETLCDAPKEMTVAGVGDLLAACNSYADWYLAFRLGMDSTYTEFPQILMGPLDRIFEANAMEIRDTTLKGMEVLAKLISLAGIAMSLSHATAPLSGFEHVISHVLDLLAEQSHQPLTQHGSQVALATLLSTSSYQKFLTEFEPDEVNPAACFPTKSQMKKQVEAAFYTIDPSGKVAAECWSDYEQKLSKWHANRSVFEEFLCEWTEIRTELERLTRPAEAVLKVLQAVGAPLRFGDLTPSLHMERVEFAYLHAPLIRKRLTLGDLFIFLNWDREKLWEFVKSYVDK